MSDYEDMDEELRRILDEGSASAQPAELADLRASIPPEPMGEELPKGTKVVFAEDMPVAAPPPSRTPITPKVVDVPGSPDDDFELAAAKAEDRQARSREAIERGTRQLIGGLTRTEALPSTPGPTDAVEKLLAKRKERDARNAQTNQQRIAAAKVDFDQQEAARKAALEATKRKEDLEEREKDNLRADRGIDATQSNADATRDWARATFAATQKNRAAGDLSDLRKEFNQLPDVKQFGEVETAYQKVKGAASDPSAAGDLSAIFAYMKMLDPGSSVREGEFANAQNAGGIDSRIVSKYNQVMKGERLAPEQRADFIRQAEKLYQTHKSRYDSQVERYRGLAQRQGASPDDVVPVQTPPAGGQRPMQMKFPDGSVHTIDPVDFEEARARGGVPNG